MMVSMSAKNHPNNAPGVPMKFPVWLENFQIRFINPMAVPLARVVPGITVIKHRGRKSGRPLETAVSASRRGEQRDISFELAGASSAREDIHNKLDE